MRLDERLASRHRYLLPAGPPVLRRPVETTTHSGHFKAPSVLASSKRMTRQIRLGYRTDKRSY
jgi:hypothetical protein